MHNLDLYFFNFLPGSISALVICLKPSYLYFIFIYYKSQKSHLLYERGVIYFGHELLLKLTHIVYVDNYKNRCYKPTNKDANDSSHIVMRN